MVENILSHGNSISVGSSDDGEDSTSRGLPSPARSILVNSLAMADALLAADQSVDLALAIQRHAVAPLEERRRLPTKGLRAAAIGIALILASRGRLTQARDDELGRGPVRVADAEHD